MMIMIILVLQINFVLLLQNVCVELTSPKWLFDWFLMLGIECVGDDEHNYDFHGDLLLMKRVMKITY